MEHVFFPPLSRIAICGGTHGNEMTGVYMLREMQKQNLREIGSVSVSTIISNPRAVDACRRYVETDLNRCFTNALLSAPITDSTPYEQRRAHEINAQLGPKGSQEAMDLVIDIHNTTSNMGLCLIFYTVDWITLHILKYIQSKMNSTPVRAIQINIPASEAYSLESVGKHGFALEAGPQPNGVIRADIYNMVKQATDLTLEWVRKFNSGLNQVKIEPLHVRELALSGFTGDTFEGGEVEAYTMDEGVDYPRDPTTTEITASIHSQLQDNDFKLLQPGDPTFMSFSGETLRHQDEELYPFFINECAYYEKKIAFLLGKKIKLTLPSISVKKD